MFSVFSVSKKQCSQCFQCQKKKNSALSGSSVKKHMSEFAKIKVERFRKRFQSQYGDGHYFFACHAAFPIAFSVDMLYQLWANFKDIPPRAVEKASSPFPLWSRTIDRLAVSDLLQSDLCRRTDRDLFEMETEVRAYLLQRLEEYFTGERLNSLARFSYQYVDRRINDPYYQAFRDTQRWVSLARLAPEKAGEQLTAYYNLMLEKDNASEITRLDGILEALTLMDARFADLSAFSKAIRAGYTDLSEEAQIATAQESLKKVVRISTGLAGQAGGLKVKLNDQLKSGSFQFKKELEKEEDLLAHRMEQSEEQGSTVIDLSGLGLTDIPKEILERRGLEAIDLSNNKLGGLPREIGNWVNLKRLILDDNPIEELPEEMRRLLVIEELSLKNNRIDFLPPWIVEYANLERLDLRGNPAGNIRKDRLLFENKSDFQLLDRYFFPKSLGYHQPMVMILITDPHERGLIQRALEPAVDQGLLHIEVPESYQSWQLFRLFRQFRDQLCFLHVNGSGTADQFTWNVGNQSGSMSLRLWNGIINSTTKGKLCFIGGGTGKRVVGDMLQTAFEACIYSTDFQSYDDTAENFISVFYESLGNGRTLGEAYDSAAGEGTPPVQQSYQQKSAPFNPNPFTIEVRGTSVMEWRLVEDKTPDSFTDLEELKSWLEERLLRGGPGAIFTPLKGMLDRYSLTFRELGELQQDWEQLQSEQARRDFYEPENSPMRVFVATLSEGQLVEGLIEFPASEEGFEQAYQQAAGEEQEPILEEGQLWFLGIGISKYMQMPDIPNAVSDVRAIQEVLGEKYRLARERTIVLFDGEADKKNIFEVLGSLAERMPSADQLILYFCGHSRFDARRQNNSWFPFDANTQDTGSHIVDMELFDFMNEIDANDILMIVDGVFPTRHLENRKFERQERNRSRSRWKLSSGYDYGLVRDGTPWGNSPFAMSIVEVLGRNKEQELIIQDIAIQVMKRYARETEAREKPDFQPLPWAGHEGGEFVLRMRYTAGEENIYDTGNAGTTEQEYTSRPAYTLEDLKSELKGKLRERAFDEIFKLINQYLNTDSKAYNDWVFQQGRYNGILQQQQKGLVNPEFAQQTFNQIADALAYHIDELNYKDINIPKS